MTIEIHGRAMYKNSPRLTISEFRWSNSEPLVTIDNAEIRFSNSDNDTFTIISRHPDGTDVEHDAAYVAYFEGAGLIFRDTHASVVGFNGVILSAKYYPTDFDFTGDKFYVCDDTTYYHAPGSEWLAGHLIMPYTPPDQRWKPAQYWIELDFEGDK